MVVVKLVDGSSRCRRVDADSDGVRGDITTVNCREKGIETHGNQLNVQLVMNTIMNVNLAG